MTVLIVPSKSKLSKLEAQQYVSMFQIHLGFKSRRVYLQHIHLNLAMLSNFTRLGLSQSFEN